MQHSGSFLLLPSWLTLTLLATLLSSQVILFSNRLVSSEVTSVLTSMSVNFNFLLVLPPTSHTDPRSPALCNSDLLPSVSFSPFLYLYFCRLQLPSCCSSASEKLNARFPMTLSAGSWLSFKIWWWHCGSEATRNCGLNGCLQGEWPLALTLIWTHCKARLLEVSRSCSY